LAQPVAFGFDEQGRAYVAETFRLNRGVEDNRGHMNWLTDDLAAQTAKCSLNWRPQRPMPCSRNGCNN
jgi:quinoprotein glucose dehydrogenase